MFVPAPNARRPRRSPAQYESVFCPAAGPTFLSTCGFEFAELRRLEAAAKRHKGDEWPTAECCFYCGASAGAQRTVALAAAAADGFSPAVLDAQREAYMSMKFDLVPIPNPVSRGRSSTRITADPPSSARRPA